MSLSQRRMTRFALVTGAELAIAAAFEPTAG